MKFQESKNLIFKELKFEKSKDFKLKNSKNGHFNNQNTKMYFEISMIEIQKFKFQESKQIKM